MLALTYQLFAVLAGWLEAILYAKRAAESFSGNEHGGMTWQRVAVLVVAGVAVLEYHWLGWAGLAIEVLPTALLFPMCHDEAYNFTRLWLKWAEFFQKQNQLALAEGEPQLTKLDRQAWRWAWNEYRYGYQSPTTTARNDFTGSSRTILASAGGLLLVALYLSYFFHFFPYHS